MEVHVIGRVCHPCKHTEDRDRACSEIFEELGRRMDDTGTRSSHIVDRMQNVGWCADYLKILYYDGSGLCLFAKRLERGKFVWPPIVDGGMVLTPAQMALLIEAIDWRRTVAPEAACRPVAV